MKVWYFVTGRISGDDADTGKLLQAVDYADAAAQFEELLVGGAPFDWYLLHIVRCGETQPVIEGSP
jgi:hypothetical protein